MSSLCRPSARHQHHARPLLPATRRLQRGRCEPFPPALSSTPLPHSPSLTLSASNCETEHPLNVKALILWSNSSAFEQLPSPLFFFFLEGGGGLSVPGAGRRYHNRINVGLSPSVTHSLSQSLDRPQPAADTCVEGETVPPDSGLGGV